MNCLLLFSKWMVGIFLAVGLNSCGVQKTQPTKVQEHAIAPPKFVENYNCPCPDGRMLPPIQRIIDNNVYFKSEGDLTEMSEIKGKIVNESNLPVSNVIVHLSNTTISDTTDADGSYTLTNIPNGTVNLIVSSENHFGCSLPVFSISKPQLFQAATIQLAILRNTVSKPVIYLYPEKETDVNIELNFKGKITHSYPMYKDHWDVHAEPNGTLTDETGRSYYALFWEGIPTKQYTAKDGFIVKGSETIPFLESVLEQLGLSEREANEFIMFWYPKLEENPYNLIHFSTDEYLASAGLNVTPAPETIIRIMMVYQPLNEAVEFPIQVLPEKPIRKGFTLVEWGGTALSQSAD